MVKTGFTAALLLVTLGLPAHAQVFKCTDQSGHVTFSDRLCNHGKNEIAHRGFSQRELYEQEIQRQETLNRQTASAYRRSLIEAEQSDAGGYADNSSSTEPVEPTGPGKRKTVSTLLPDGAGFAQKEAAQQRRNAERREQRRNAEQWEQQRSRPAPTSMTHCAGGFCYDNQGSPYSKVGNSGTMISPTGKVCQTVGNMVQCH